MLSEERILREQKHSLDIRFRMNFYRNKSISKDHKIINTDSYQKYKEAVNEYISSKNSIWFYFVKDGLEKIRLGDKNWIEDALLYLEVDPYYFRSGYLKEKLLKALKSAPIDALPIERMHKLIIFIIKKCFRRELIYYCKVAKKSCDC